MLFRSVRPQHAVEVQALFASREIACADVGEVCAGSAFHLVQGREQALLWDHAEAPFIAGRSPS